MALLITVCACEDVRQDDSARTKKALELQHVEVWSKGNTDLIPNLYTEDYVGHFPGGETVYGHDGIRQTVESHRIAFPDWNEAILDILVEGDRAVTRFRSQGTHEGEFLGVPATGNEIQILEASVYRILDGQIAEQWVFPDIASLQRQLSIQKED